MIKASTDITYCTNVNCTNKCWRHKDKWQFEDNANYWFMEKCEEKLYEYLVKNK